MSFSLAVPAARLFTRQINAHIGKGIKHSKPVKMTNQLRQELEHWKFLDNWNGFLPWKQEKHFSVEIISDASDSGWGGILSSSGSHQQSRDYLDKEDIDLPGIAIREAKAPFKTLSSFSNEIYNGRVDAYIGNTNLLDFWNTGRGKNISLTNEIKDLFFLSLKLNIDLKMFYIPSKLNDADTPSRFSSHSDCSLSDSAWNLLKDSFGPHTFDLMAIPSNVRRSKHGGKLNFFSPFPFEESSGVNVFAQSLSFEENYYVFPPFLLVGPLIRFLRERCSRASLVAPDVSPRKYW